MKCVHILHVSVCSKRWKKALMQNQEDYLQMKWNRDNKDMGLSDIPRSDTAYRYVITHQILQT